MWSCRASTRARTTVWRCLRARDERRRRLSLSLSAQVTRVPEMLSVARCRQELLPDAAWAARVLADFATLRQVPAPAAAAGVVLQWLRGRVVGMVRCVTGTRPADYRAVECAGRVVPRAAAAAA